MSFNHRQGGQWNTPTAKKRENGQWVTVGGGGGGGGGSGGTVDTSAYYTDGPPERDGQTITYDGTNYSSATDAVHDLNPGDSLYIDPSNSPYVERLNINQNVSNHITIYSDLDLSYSTDGIATINREGATFRRPSGDSRPFHVYDQIKNPENWGITSLEGSHDGLHEGAETTEINVTDSSGISIGDQIVIWEDSRPYGLEPSGGASGVGETMEYANVVDISGNTITIDQPLAMTYPNNSATEVGPADWTIEDLHVSGIRFDANRSSSDHRAGYIGTAYKCWFDNIIGLRADRKPTFFNQYSFFNRFDLFWMHDGNHYGLNNQNGSTRSMCTRMMGSNHNRYTVRFGPSGHSVPRGYVNNIAGNGLRRTTGGVHQGGHHVHYENLTATDTRAIVTRSWYITLDGFEVVSGNDQGPPLVCAQQPGYVTVKNGTIGGMEGTGQRIWQFRMRGDNDAPWGEERITNVTYENIDIDAYSDHSITELGNFEIKSDSPVQGPLTFRNITYGGQKLTKSDVEAWPGYDSNIIPDLTVE